ncbi:MAG: hypothetical protein ABSB22_15285 [Thermodesulfobacteriota bacterium]|jgi:hypothetical protein
MNNIPRRKLCEIIAQYGVSLYDDPLRCEGLLSDFCGGYKKEIFILVCALKQKVPADMLSFSGKIPVELIMVQLANRLQAELSINKCAARWGTESWALALGLISVSDLKKQAPKNRTLPPKNFHNSVDNDLNETSNANSTLINKPDIGHDSLNLKAKTGKEMVFRRVALMALMMYVGLLMGWVLSTIY